MTNNLLQIKIKQRLNKLGSFDYDNIENWMIQEAANKAQIEWVRRQMYGINQRREGAEQTSGMIDDLQRLLKQETLLMVAKQGNYFESTKLPDDYLHYVRCYVKAASKCCPEREMTTWESEEANLSILLVDDNRKPNFEWAETLVTLMGNKLRVYTDGEFDITRTDIIYYRMPIRIEFNGCINIDTGELYKADQPCEFNDNVAEIIIDEAASILAGDLESMTQYQRESQEATKNT